jgi:hypothetical protein
MKNILVAAAAVFSLLSFSSCEKDIVLDVKQAPPATVIEGLVTNQMTRQWVRVTKSTDFYQRGLPPAVTNATITVTDNAGNSYGFVYYPDTTITGLYLSAEPFAGVVGNTYTLKVNVPNEGEYTANDILTAGATQIGSLCVVEDANVRRFNINTDYIYEMNFTIQQPNTGETSYWLFKAYRNDSLKGDRPFIQDGSRLRTVIEDLSGPENYRIGDKARFEVYSLSRKMFVYYSDLGTVLNNDGGMFSPPPANPVNNISGGKGNAVGYFQCSSVITEQIEVAENTVCVD